MNIFSSVCNEEVLYNSQISMPKGAPCLYFGRLFSSCGSLVILLRAVKLMVCLGKSIMRFAAPRFDNLSNNDL